MKMMIAISYEFTSLFAILKQYKLSMMAYTRSPKRIILEDVAFRIQQPLQKESVNILETYCLVKSEFAKVFLQPNVGSLIQTMEELSSKARKRTSFVVY